MFFFWVGLWRTIRCVTFWTHRKTSRHTNGDIPFHPNCRNSSQHKNLLAKWCWLCSLTLTNLFLDLKPCDNTINPHCCCHTLQKLHTIINNKCLIKLTEGINLLHNNIHPHVAHRDHDQLHAMLWEVLKHHVHVDSPDLFTYNFQTFRPLK